MTQEKITGEIEKIRFENSDGFIIALFRYEKKKVSILGNILNPHLGVEYTLTGCFSKHPKFGRQFKFSSFETHIPQDENGIFKYLVRICKFVGPGIGNLIVKKYGTDSINILKNNPKIVAQEIKGITKERAISISEQLKGNENNEKLMVQMESMLNVHGMRKNLIHDLIKKYQANAPEILKKNPYVLTEFSGIGFPLADRVALHVGYDLSGIERKKAVCLHVVVENMKSCGHTWIDQSELLKKANELVTQPNIVIGLKALQKERLLIRKNNLWAMSWVCEQEIFIAEKINMFLEV